MNKGTSSTREAQRRYRSRQKAKLEGFRQKVEVLSRRLTDLDVKRAGLASQNKILEETAAAIHTRQEKEAQAASYEAQKWDPATAQHFARFSNLLRQDLVVEVSEEDARDLTHQDIAALMKDFYRQVADAVEAPGQDAAKDRIVTRLLVAKNEFRKALESMGARAAAAVTASLYSGKTSSVHPSLEAVQRGLDILHLKDDQKADLLASRARLLRKHAEIKRERMEIVGRMQRAIECDKDDADEGTSAGFLLEEVEALEELKRNLETEHDCVFRFHSEFGDALTPLQYAKVLAYNQTQNVKPWPLCQLLAAQECTAKERSLPGLPQMYEDSGVTESDSRQTTATPQQRCRLKGTQAMHGSPKLEPTLRDGENSHQPQRGRTGLTSSGLVQSGAPRGSCAEVPSNAAATDSTAADSQCLAEGLDSQTLFDDILLDLPDPLDIDFGQPSTAGTEPLWALIQNLGSIEPVGVKL